MGGMGCVKIVSMCSSCVKSTITHKQECPCCYIFKGWFTFSVPYQKIKCYVSYPNMYALVQIFIVLNFCHSECLSFQILVILNACHSESLSFQIAPVYTTLHTHMVREFATGVSLICNFDIEI